METIGSKICGLRRKLKLSQEELGYELGVSRQTISKWETGKAIPDMLNLIAISEFFKVEVFYFIASDAECANVEAASEKACDEEAADFIPVEEKTSLSGRGNGCGTFVKVLLLVLGVLASLSAYLTVRIGLILFSPSIRDGNFEKVYFSDFNFTMMDLFLIGIIVSIILVIGVVIIGIAVAENNKKFNGGKGYD